MSATHDNAIAITVAADSGRIDTQDFGTPLLATDQLEAGFTERVRFYESVTEVNADADLQADTVARLNLAFAQTPRSQRLAVGRINFAVTVGDELDAIRAESDDWYGLAASTRAELKIIDIAAWAETNERLYAAQTSDAALLAGTALNIGEDLRLATRDHTTLLYHSDDTVAADLAWLAKKLGKDPDSGTTTWRHATLTGVTPDVITSTEKGNVETENANTYLTLFGQGATGKGLLSSGNQIDTRISRDWIDARISEGIAVLFLGFSNRNESIPYDNDGISLVAGVVEEWFGRGESLRHFRVGSTSLVIPKIEDIATADITARILRLNGSATLAGSIEEVAITITVLFG